MTGTPGEATPYQSGALRGFEDSEDFAGLTAAADLLRSSRPSTLVSEPDPAPAPAPPPTPRPRPEGRARRSTERTSRASSAATAGIDPDGVGPEQRMKSSNVHIPMRLLEPFRAEQDRLKLANGALIV